MNQYLFCFILLLLMMSGCDLYEQDSYKENYVVESYLIADNPMQQVLVSRTLPVEEEYTFAKAALDNATVTIDLLDENGEISNTYAFGQQSRGVYVPVNSESTVIGGRRYQLTVNFPNGDTIKAETLVPGTFRTVNQSADTTTYQSEEQIEITTTPSVYPGRQTYFIFTINAVNPQIENFTPFYADIFDENDDDISDFYVNSSGIINEGNYDRNDDNTLTVRVPWIAIAFYNENDIIINAIDDNMYDFLRSQEVQGGGSTLSPGEIQNVVYNVEGGIGIFGSMASDTNRVFITRQ